MMIPDTVQFLERPDQPKLAYIYTPAKIGENEHPCIVFCGGFKSDMMGTKAEFLEQKCKEIGTAFLRFDYRGHGFSSGNFIDGTIGQWRDDVLAILDHLNLHNVILVGSSMGGWISLLIAREQISRVRGLVGIAAAPDFTDDMYFNRISDEHRATLDQEGHVNLPNDYSDEPYIITKALIDDGRDQFVLDTDKPLILNCPVHLLQGKLDADVPWKRAEDIKNKVQSTNVQITYIDDGDHRLSRNEDLELLWKTINDVCVSL